MDKGNRVAIVTGAANGIGRAIAFALARHGCTPVIADLDPAGGLAVVEELRALGFESLSYEIDITDVGRIAELVADVSHRYGRIDILVNNAGMLSNTPIPELGEAEWDRVMAVNVKGAMFAIQQVLPHMTERGWGRIVSVSSVAGRNGGVSASPAYAASKAALIGMTMCVAKKVAGVGITVNAIAPGTTETEMIKGFTPEEHAAIRKSIPVGKLGRPEDLAEMVAFLASDSAAFMTGAVVDMNGGMFMG